MKDISLLWFYRLLLSGLVIFFFGCSPDKKTPLLELLPSDHTGIEFSNQLFEDEFLNIISFEYFYNGAGVGIGDINNDGLPDIFFTANMVSNRLYLNKGNFVFEDITKTSGITFTGKWATGVSMVDINQDGWLDIYICYAGPFADAKKRENELYINNGDNTFSEQALQYGLNDTGHSVQAAFFDYDKDGDLDVYLLTNITDETGPNVIRPKRVKGEMVNTDRLYRNNGDGTFTNISEEAGITIEGYGLGVSVTDINMDGWPDIYVTNDYLSNDLLYINNRDGTFTNQADIYFKHTSYSAMGHDVADFNNDGLSDIIAADMLPPDNTRQKLMFGATNYDRHRSEIMYGYSPQYMRNTLQLNQGFGPDSSLLFSEIGQLAGIQATDWSWSCLFADLDNDGWKDLIITNGYPKDITNRDFASYKANQFVRKGFDNSVMQNLTSALSTLEGAYLPNYVFKNTKGLIFSDMSPDWGFTQPGYSTGAAYADLDNDGDLDIVVNNTNAPAFIYKNNAGKHTKHHFLKLAFNGPKGNSHGLGTKVIIYKDDSLQYFEHSPYRGFQSTVEMGIHSGMGNAEEIDSILIQWPDGKIQRLEKVSTNQALLIDYINAGEAAELVPFSGKTSGYFQPAGEKYTIGYTHQESHYIDFKIQPLVPQKYSQNGPGIAVGDINKDGLEDFYVGGAFNQSGQFFIQKKNGSFESQMLTAETKYEEDMGVLLFDADNDGDLDLYVVSGGNEFKEGSQYYQDRLYFNDGKGNFTYRPEALPSFFASGSCVIAADYDQDGDLDLFVGGRLTPHSYPFPGQSYLLKNNGGKFEDVTDVEAPGLKNIGMVTSALWTDVNNDNIVDLIVVGEWMPVTIFLNENKKLRLWEDAVPNSSGWWNSIYGADFDNDGDIDYILGNLGLNSRYKTSEAEPVSVHITDLNGDGVYDPIISCFIQGVNRPAHPRDDLLLQVSSVKKKYPNYAAYAKASLEDVIEAGKEQQAMRAQTFASSYLENKGKEGWLLKPLPQEAQFAPVFGIVAEDYTGDGHKDILLTGNSHAPDVLTGRYDAFIGLLLKGDGKGNSISLSVQQSGILIDGDAKGLATLNQNGNQILLAAQNNDTLRVFERVHKPDQILPVNTNDQYAIITLSDGRQSKHEFYYGGGYLSQSSRSMVLPKDVVEVVIYDFLGKSRKISKGDIKNTVLSAAVKFTSGVRFMPLPQRDRPNVSTLQ